MTGYNEGGRLTTVPYASSFLLFNGLDTTIFQYDAAEEEFQEMPVNMTQSLGYCNYRPSYGYYHECDRGTPILIDLDMFPPTCNEDAT